MHKVLKQMDSSIENLETDLKNAQRWPLESDDRQDATYQNSDLNLNLFIRLQHIYKIQIPLKWKDFTHFEHFVFEVQKYSIEEFISDIKTFKTQLKIIN